VRDEQPVLTLPSVSVVVPTYDEAAHVVEGADEDHDAREPPHAPAIGASDR
jgi:hypothetical protein